MFSTQKELEVFVASYAGFDGGNPKARVWICGIEPGGEPKNGNFSIISDIPCWDEQFKKENRSDYQKWPYNQRVSKLMVAVDEWTKDKSLPIDIVLCEIENQWKKCLKDNLYSYDGNSFKMNLFPLSCPSTSLKEWEKHYGEFPLLKEKDAYQELCRARRFDTLLNLREKYKPEIILGTGLRFKDDFVKAFGFNIKSEIEYMNPLHLYQYSDNEERSTLIVCPFFRSGRGTISGNKSLADLAKHISDLIHR